MDCHRSITHCPDTVGNQRQTGDVVQMGMRQENVVNFFQRFNIQVSDTGPGIDQDIVIDHVGAGTSLAPDCTAASQYANFHSSSDLKDKN